MQPDDGFVKLGTRLHPDTYALIKSFAEDNDMTVYELLQYLCLSLATYIGYKKGATTELSENVSAFIDAFRMDDVELVERRLEGLRESTGLHTKQEDRSHITQLIILNDKGTFEVWDRLDYSSGMGGTITVDDAEKALRLILGDGGKLNSMYTNVMADRNTRSIFHAIKTLFAEENAYLHHMDDEMLGYAQNEYGNVPKQHRNKNMN